jgi:hypothetical protein
MRVPAVCDNCGRGWVAALPITVIDPQAFYGQLEGIRVRCPFCGVGTGKVPAGLFDFTRDALSALSSWRVDRLEQLTLALATARESEDERAAAEAAINEHSDLAELARRLSPLKDAGAFWCFVAVLVAAATLFIMAQSGTQVTINERVVIERVTEVPHMSNDAHSEPGQSRPYGGVGPP